MSAQPVPIVWTYSAVIAGVGHWHYRVFALYNLAGALLPGVRGTMFGFWLGQYVWVGKNMDMMFILIVPISALPNGAELLKVRRFDPVQR